MKSSYAPYIDGLRAIAVLSVIAYHLNPKILPGGFTGVDIFFVISGFVVSASVGELQNISFSQFLTYFYSRRLFRIAPALIVCLLVTTFTSALFVPFAWLSGTSQDTGRFAFFGLSNLVLAQTGNDYFSPRVEFNPFAQTWSLGIEEQFYLIFPWLFVAWLRQRKSVSVALVTSGLMASLVCAYWLGVRDPNRAFYLITSRFWELAAGVLLFQLMSLSGQSFGSTRVPSRLATVGATVSAMMLGVGIATVSPNTTPFPGGVPLILGTIGILGFLHGRSRAGIVLQMLENRAMRFIGRISYSLYLWHWPVFVLFRWTAGLESLSCCAAALAVTFALSIVSFYLVETPPRRALAAFGFPRLVAAAVGLGALLIGYDVSSWITAREPKISLSTVTKHAFDWYPDYVDPNAQYLGCRIQSDQLSLSEGVLWSFSRVGCSMPIKSQHQLFIIGDSHANVYRAMIAAFTLDTGVQAYLYGNGGCPFLSLRDYDVYDPQCLRCKTAAITDLLTKIHPGDVVFLPSLRMPRIVDQWAPYGLEKAKNEFLSPEAEGSRRAQEESALPILREITGRGAEIVFEAPTPVFKSVPFRCADWYDRSNPICSGGNSIERSTIYTLRAPVMAIFSHFEHIPGVYVWDPMPILCPGDVCSTSRDGYPLFFDGDHLSGYSNRLLLPYFETFVRGVIRTPR
jgi:peptidoglycan/LPS O-acetylase OafA/YrhL